MPEDDMSYEIIPVTPMKKIEERLDKIESVGGPSTTLQNLINQIIELIRSNQKIVNDVIRANSDLRNELSKLPPKIDDLINTMNNFLSLVEAASKEEVETPAQQQNNADMLKPVVDELKKISDQNQRLVESNENVMEELDKLSKRVKGGMPVSSLLSSYPLKRDARTE
jgi:chromosome segregation ATPase